MKITFQNLKDISDTLSKGDDTLLVAYLNKFKGDNIYQKFLNILKAWEDDVAHSMSFSIGDKNIKVTLAYTIECFGGISNDNVIIEDGHIYELGIPDKFTINDVFDFSRTLKKVKIGNQVLEMSAVNNIYFENYMNNLPASIYNKFAKAISNNTQHIKGFNHPALDHIKINFLNNSAYIFLKGLLNPYDKDYFRDIIYHLSKKIDGDILMNSTISDIEYYTDKMNSENTENDIPNLS